MRDDEEDFDAGVIDDEEEAEIPEGFHEEAEPETDF